MELYEALRNHTMVPEPTFRANLELARSVRLVPGCFVECGVWKGGMIAGISSIAPHKHAYIFDSFQGLPPAQEIDGEAAAEYQRNVDAPDYRDNCKASMEDVIEAMRIVNHKNYSIIPGWFRYTIPSYPMPPISLLRIDADWYDSTKTCLDHLYDRVVSGGLIIIDDYHAWEGCRRAVHSFSRRMDVQFSLEDSVSLCWMVKP